MQYIIDFLTSSRVKSFLWRLGSMFLSGGINAISTNIAGLDLGSNGTVILGLILGEISKHLNSPAKVG
jgi:hypothetical protein